MKKFLWLVALLLTTNLAFAQLSQGNLLVTGAFSISSNTSEVTNNSRVSDGPTTTDFAFVPNVSYFLTNNFSLGLEIGFNRNSTTSDFTTDNGNTSVTVENVVSTFAFGPFVRYYVPLGNNFYFYGQGGIQVYGGTEDETETAVTQNGNTTITVINNTTTDLSGFSTGLKPGITYFLNNRFALDASFGLLQFATNGEKRTNYERRSNQVDFNIIPNSLTFGLSYRFGGTGN